MFLKKKEPDASTKKPKSLQEIAHERVLTAEGRQRRMTKKQKKTLK